MRSHFKVDLGYAAIVADHRVRISEEFDGERKGIWIDRRGQPLRYSSSQYQRLEKKAS